MLVVSLLMPPWIYGCWKTIKQFQTLSVVCHTARIMGQQQARCDPLTKILNRLVLAEVLANDDQSAALTVFCVDLDGFKQVNDTFGHLVGDILLQRVTARIRHALRETDTLARCGGDEFVIVAPGLSPAASEVLATRLVEAISADPYRIDDGVVVSVGMSVGFARRPQDAMSVRDLNRLADNALYAAKRHQKGAWRRCAVLEAI